MHARNILIIDCNIIFIPFYIRAGYILSIPGDLNGANKDIAHLTLLGYYFIGYFPVLVRGLVVSILVFWYL